MFVCLYDLLVFYKASYIGTVHALFGMPGLFAK